MELQDDRCLLNSYILSFANSKIVQITKILGLCCSRIFISPCMKLKAS